MRDVIDRARLMNFGGLSFRRSPLTPPSCAHSQSLPREINVELARKRFLFYLWLMVCRHLQRPAWPGTARKIMLRCPSPPPMHCPRSLTSGPATCSSCRHRRRRPRPPNFKRWRSGCQQRDKHTQQYYPQLTAYVAALQEADSDGMLCPFCRLVSHPAGRCSSVFTRSRLILAADDCICTV